MTIRLPYPPPAAHPSTNSPPVDNDVSPCYPGMRKLRRSGMRARRPMTSTWLHRGGCKRRLQRRLGRKRQRRRRRRRTRSGRGRLSNSEWLIVCMLQNVARNLLLIDDTPYYRVSGAKKARTEGTRGRPVVVSDSDSEEEAPRGFSSSLLEKIFRETQLRAERAEQALVTMRYLADAGMDTKSVLANYFRGGPSGSQQGGPSQTDGLMAGSEDEGGGNNQPGEPRLTPAGGGPAVPPLGFRPATARPPAEVGEAHRSQANQPLGLDRLGFRV